MTRLDRLGATLERPLLVTTPSNVVYLTGFRSSNCALLVAPGGVTTLYTDFRYADAAQGVAGVTFVQTRRDVVGALAELLAGDEVEVEAANLTVARHDVLTGGGVRTVAGGGHVEALRAIKDSKELEAIRKACAISDRVFAELAREQLSGRTEREVAWWVERRLREEGGEGLSFPPIVASGPNGAKPHAVPGDRIIGRGELVTVDMGCIADGYYSDCTRTFATGTVTGELAEIYALCEAAQLDGLAAVRAGESGKDVDAASRVKIEAAGRADQYGHGLGHGVGLEIHEAPTLRPESTDTLAAGNVVSVEPGIYVPGIGGVRIEDLVTVTDDGCEIFTRYTKELVEVG
ncbi:MAG: Xaa-Pro peptidase family protein [Gaiellales bacterium]